MRVMTKFVITVLLVPFALMVALVGGPAAAQDVKEDKELTEHAQKIDKTADRAAPEKVVDKIAKQFNVAPSEVQALRTKLGFGGITIALALASRTGKSPEAILQMRQSGMGWGQIAQQSNVTVGSIIRDVKAAKKGVEEVAKADSKHPERVGKVEKAERLQKSERIERMERPERSERPGR